MKMKPGIFALWVLAAGIVAFAMTKMAQGQNALFPLALAFAIAAAAIIFPVIASAVRGGAAAPGHAPTAGHTATHGAASTAFAGLSAWLARHFTANPLRFAMIAVGGWATILLLAGMAFWSVGLLQASIFFGAIATLLALTHFGLWPGVGAVLTGTVFPFVWKHKWKIAFGVCATVTLWKFAGNASTRNVAGWAIASIILALFAFERWTPIGEFAYKLFTGGYGHARMLASWAVAFVALAVLFNWAQPHARDFTATHLCLAIAMTLAVAAIGVAIKTAVDSTAKKLIKS